METIEYRPSMGIRRAIDRVQYSCGFLRRDGYVAMASDELVAAIADEDSNGLAHGWQMVSVPLASGEWLPEKWLNQVEPGTVFLNPTA